MTKHNFLYGGERKSSAFNNITDMNNIIIRFNTEAEELIKKQQIVHLVKRTASTLGIRGKPNKNYVTSIESIISLYDRFITGIIRGAQLKKNKLNYQDIIKTSDIINFIKLINTKIFYIKKYSKNSDKIYCIRIRNLLRGTNLSGNININKDNKTVIYNIINNFNDRFKEIANIKYNIILTESREDHHIILGVNTINKHPVFTIVYDGDKINIKKHGSTKVKYYVKKTKDKQYNIYDNTTNEIVNINPSEYCKSENLSDKDKDKKTDKDKDKKTDPIKASSKASKMVLPKGLHGKYNKSIRFNMGDATDLSDKVLPTSGTAQETTPETADESTAETAGESTTETLPKSILKKPNKNKTQKLKTRTINISITIPDGFNIDTTDNGNNNVKTSIQQLHESMSD
jgi:hypothetical protein